jgi:hypothetical protein
MDYPIQAAVANGRVYVVEWNSSRVSVFGTGTPCGVPDTDVPGWGTYGDGPGEFDHPEGIAIHGGNVYVADGANDRIQVFDLDGTPVGEWGTTGPEDGQFQLVAGIAVDSSGYVYTGSYEPDRIQKFSPWPDPDFITKWGGVENGSGPCDFAHAQKLAVDGAGNIFVADHLNSRIVKIVQGGGCTVFAGVTRNGHLDEPQYCVPPDEIHLCLPLGVAVDGNGNVFVSDNGNNRIVMFDPNGNYLTSWGITSPFGMALDGPFGNLYVASWDTSSISVFSVPHPAPPSSPPGAPTGVSATPGDGQADVSWTAPSADGGSAITGYTAASSPGNLTCATAGLSCTVTGLTNGTPYTFTVTATNAVGPGPASAPSNSVTPSGPVTVPGAPTGVSATPGDGQADVSWTAPSADGGSAITGYTATSSPGDVTCATAGLSCIVSGLTNGTPYTFTVTATNAAGPGPASAPSNSVTPSAPATVPGAPTGVSATPGNAQAHVSWTAPSSDGGSAITGYTATSSPDNLTCATAGLSCTVSGLTDGTPYTFTVTATNAVGPGPASAPSNSVTPAGPTVPGAPTGVSATPGNAQAHVSWTAPSSDGGSAITGYTATSSPDNLTCATAGLSCTVSGLTDGTPYTFTVTATNAVGPGPASAPSNSVTPSASIDTTAPVVSAPAGVLFAPQALGTTARLRLAWLAATDPSGIARYELQSKKGTRAWINVALTSPTATSADVALVPNKKYAFRLRATDGAGNVGAWVTTTAAKLGLVQETATAITYTGTWKHARLAGASGNHVRYASTSTATARLTFTGSSVALVSTLREARGMADIWLDGVKVATVDFYAPTTQNEAIVWASALLSPGSHTLEIRLLGTKGAAATSTRVDIDALLVWL